MVDRFVRGLGSEEDIHDFGSSVPPGRIVSRVVSTNLCTPSKVGERPIVVITIAGGRVHSELSEVGTRVVKGSISPFCGTPIILVILTSGTTPACLCSNALMVRGLVLTTRSRKLKDY